MVEENIFMNKIKILEDEIRKLKIRIGTPIAPVITKRIYISFEERKKVVLTLLEAYYPKPINFNTIRNESGLKLPVIPVVLDDLLYHGMIKEYYGGGGNSHRGEKARKHKVGRLFILNKNEVKK